MTDKLRKEAEINSEEACELIELAIDELTLLTRTFDVISSACSLGLEEDEHAEETADPVPSGLHLFH